MSVLDELPTTVATVVRQQIAPAAATLDRRRAFPSDNLRALAEAGALGLLVPVSHGGAGGGLEALSAACEEIGGACASTGMTFLMHSVAAATAASDAPAHGRAAELLAGIASGALLGTLAFSERGTGAHFYAPELQAVHEEGRVRISGRKSFVTSGGHADVYLVLVQSDETEGLDCYVVERDAPGVSFDGAWEGLGMAGNASVAMQLDDVAVDADARIGAPGAGAELVFGVVAPVFLVGLAAVNVGIAAAALATATAHAAGRHYADGSVLAEVQAIQHALADMDMAVRATRGLVREAARLGDADDDGALVPIMEAKVAATTAAEAVTQRALEVCGGQGYTPALPIARHLRDARAGAVMAPTNLVLRSWIGKALAGLPVP